MTDGDVDTSIAPVTICFEDEHLLVVSKPPGLLVHRTPLASPRETFLLQHLSLQVGRTLYTVHRLDRNTSGVLCFACSSEAARRMHDLLADMSTMKSYLALARGETETEFVCDRPLRNDKKEPRPARTEFRRLATFSRSSLLEARLCTGRFHQIRRHLAHLAHQIIGDTNYGKGRINAFLRAEYGLPRMFLHAWRLAFDHPVTGRRVEVIDPLAPDLLGYLRRLPDVDAALIERLAEGGTAPSQPT